MYIILFSNIMIYRSKYNQKQGVLFAMRTHRREIACRRMGSVVPPLYRLLWVAGWGGEGLTSALYLIEGGRDEQEK